MTKIPLQTLLIPCLLLSGWILVSCDKPELATREAKPEATAPQLSQTPASSSGPVIHEPATHTSDPESPGTPPEPTHPELEVFREGDTIVIKGALKSRLQKKRIADDFARDIPDLKVDDQLVVEAHRYPVGWGNRVSVGFLIPYFMEIEDPYVGYKEGVVILKGKCKKQGEIRYYQELAVNIFAGMHLTDIQNELVVSGN